MQHDTSPSLRVNQAVDCGLCCPSPLQWLCEIPGYWRELEHDVIHVDPEHPKHAQWVNCCHVKTLVRTTSTHMSVPETVSDSLCRKSLVVQTYSFINCPSLWSQTIPQVRSQMWRSWAGVVTLGLRL